MTDNQDYINKMYDSSLESQKSQLESDYNENQANLEAEQKKAQKQTDANLARTYVEAAKAQKNYNEVQNAYGLTSGAMAQARLAQDNQLQADMTTIRAAQQTVDADVERQKSLLAQQYASAIAKAQADNDLARAQALYEEAKEAEAQLLQQQKEAASLMAGAGDYSLLAEIYGLTPEQLARLQGGTGGGSGYAAGGYGGGGDGSGGSGITDLDGSGGSGNIGDATGNSSGGRGGVMGQNIRGRMLRGNGQPNGMYDFASIADFGNGNISPENLADMVSTGQVEMYWDGGTVKFRKKENGK